MGEEMTRAARIGRFDPTPFLKRDSTTRPTFATEHRALFEGDCLEVMSDGGGAADEVAGSPVRRDRAQDRDLTGRVGAPEILARYDSCGTTASGPCSDPPFFGPR